MLKKRETTYGGQALVEGVMFAGKKSFVSAIRRKDNSIEYFQLKRVESNVIKNLKKIPFLRGIIALVQASANGVKHLDFASDRYDVDPEDDEKVKQEKETSKLVMILGIGVIGVLSFIVSKLIFTVTPAIVANFFQGIVPTKTGQVLLEGFFKLLLLLGYIYVVSLTPLIKRVFQYHGAEHKVINAYENNLPLTVENVQKQSRLHYRCGSSFILFTVFVGIFVYMFVATDPLWWRIVNRIILIPIVIGLSFEVLQLTNLVRNVPILKVLGYPGLWLQLLTTKEPDDDQVEVALHSFQKVLENDQAEEAVEVNLIENSEVIQPQ
ncbi:DUF1385 domain-containing protein [Pseudogracilibacillus auburnensis]|uniref:DUF1385 domain-containing protein n=1 Tax=Pseudogracilibacillus auburnensis TaxID=1494959 RepID=UPI001A979DF9|nr:DUF1385 domain-containing protein [Pseudogracilibacillus auburnensis]MBO1004285.1 DUF1385 domain-containing protein [Pseudogracilibacillus auburnensis]